MKIAVGIKMEDISNDQEICPAVILLMPIINILVAIIVVTPLSILDFMYLNRILMAKEVS